MTNATIDNTLDAQNVILWQYDNAEKFCKLVGLIEGRCKEATEEFWNEFRKKVHGLFGLDEGAVLDNDQVINYALALWGTRIGMPRPVLTVGGVERSMGAVLYRKVLMARIRLMASGKSLADIQQYCDDIFGEGKVIVTDGQDMSIGYATSPDASLTGELAALYELGDYWKFYPAGVMDNSEPATRFLAFKGQYLAEKGAGSAAATTTKPNFFSGIDSDGVDWRGVFHPKTRKWRFYDEEMNPVEGSYAMAYSAYNGKWTLTTPSGSAETQSGHETSVWCDYGLYFPGLGIIAVWA